MSKPDIAVHPLDNPEGDIEPRADFIDLSSARISLEPGLRGFLAEATERRWQLFFDYWHDLATSVGRLPGRREVDPVQMPRKLLPNIFLTDVLHEADGRPRFRFRLLGQEIVDYEYTRPGQYLDELVLCPEQHALFEAQYLDCLNLHLRLRAGTLRWRSDVKSVIAYDVLLLPLACDGREVNAMIGLAIYRN
ncbi:PAS domain-containing protein [Dongia soli]|uniref:PAS domain-containing protein n=1 Tax=Dongia soli TaxID=600628 RepID=A0ABU5EES7_9PROT|nr:PAS domain-containing protein [Dongia soli]MDY0884851.1 PAS domain-containing protein [Dongia soli]